MAKNTGILLTIDGDLQVNVKRNANGQVTQGITIGNVTEQNMSVILQVQPGEIKEYPLIGVGINDMLLSHDALLFKHRIRQQLTTDGYRINDLKIENGNIYIDANYK